MILCPMAAKRRAPMKRAADRGRMMTTIELPPALHQRARIYGIRRKLSFRAVVEQALRDFLARKEDSA